METTKPTVVNCQVQCLEVSISKSVLENLGHNLIWTLSVYTLDNQPLHSLFEEVDVMRFRFMVYDWKKTIKRLLDGHQIPYSTDRFILDSVHRQSKRKIQYAVKDCERRFGKNSRRAPDPVCLEEIL